MISEKTIIDFLQQSFATDASNGIGIGDDAACIPIDDKNSWVISKDLFIEDVHFRRRYFEPKQIAHKALHVNLSDIAAMGAHPQYVLLGIAIPREENESWVQDFLTGFSQACHQMGVRLIGGDTTESKAGLYISITVIGKALTQHLKYRHTAQTHDVICVAGHLGEAHAGLMALEQQRPGLEDVKQRFLAPTAKVAEGEWLGARREVTAMMDISDGLYIDLSRLCKSAGKGAVIQLENLQPSEQLVAACQALHADPQSYQLVGGEDFALLFTLNPATLTTMRQAYKARFDEGFMVIGQITADNSVILTKNGRITPFELQSFSHFGEAD